MFLSGYSRLKKMAETTLRNFGVQSYTIDFG